MIDYKKTGEDKNYEYYSNVSEVESEEGDEEVYIKILNKRNEFSVKILNKEIKIKKISLNKIMILSQSQPEEQVLFSLYKTVSKNSDEIKKLKSLQDNNDINILNNDINIKRNSDNNLTNSNINIKSDKINNNIKIISDPLSGDTPFRKNNDDTSDNNKLIINNDVISNTKIEEDDKEELTFKKDLNLDAEVLVGLPPEALKIKWFYLLLTIIGIAYIIIFLVGIFNSDVGLNLYIFSLFLIGVEIFITGALGFVKINKRIFNNIAVIILTFISLFGGIVGAIIVNLNEKTERYFNISLIFGIISFCFSLLCLFWTNKLRKNILVNRAQKAEKLV